MRVQHQVVQATDPPVARLLFSDTRFAWIWLIVRLWLGYSWLSSGFGKLNNPAWMNNGEALQRFWTNALQTEPRPIIAFEWYREFIRFMLNAEAFTWFSKLVVFGELVVGMLLILGAFTGIAALIGGFMNWNFMMAGTASTNPMFFLASVLLILAWKTAGYWGLDRWLLPHLGTPWRPAFVVRDQEQTGASSLAD